MWRNKEEKTKITLQVGDRITTWETPYVDCDLTELLDALSGLFVAHTWLPETIYRGMKEYAEDQLSVYEKKENDVE